MSLSIDQLGELFEAVQLQNSLGDGKTFPDCIAKKELSVIQQDYQQQKSRPDFDLKKFVLANFDLPASYASDFKTDANRTAAEHIHVLWDVLTRQPIAENSSLISLPYPYVVPGGRFREIYYWDSYFTMLGLKVSGKVKLIEEMINNFSFLIDHIGYIPNGNRSYFIGRSQPPFYSLMVMLLSELKNPDVLVHYLPQLEKEYAFWMRGSDQLSDTNPSAHRVVWLAEGMILNRYWDENTTPRPEAYKEDVELSHHSRQKPEVLFRNLRAAAESGWDFSSRWFEDEKDFSTIHTTDIIPVDLNCLLHHLELTIAKAYEHNGNQRKAMQYLTLASNRKAAILKYCWSAAQNFFVDYDFVKQHPKKSLTAAGVFPLFFQLATTDQALAVSKRLAADFVKPGGLTTTLQFSGQQWDAPNGWAPLQWIAFQGLKHYNFNELANTIKINWTKANEQVFRTTGKMTEKYDVWNENAEASGGEYPNQDGFGWTNGVYLAMQEKI